MILCRSGANVVTHVEVGTVKKLILCRRDPNPFELLWETLFIEITRLLVAGLRYGKITPFA